MKHIDIHPGFNESILSALKMRVAAMTDLEKIVSIAFDEMSIRQGLSRDKGKDVEGFRHELVRGKEVANHAMAFMVRGIASKWKQPLGYFLTSGTMVGSVINILLRQCIDKLKNIGLTVVICVCDQGSNNQSLFKQLGITTKAPYFMHNSSQVFMMFDPPHLLKNVRNNMKKHGYSMGENSISWDHVQTFYEVDTSKPIRMAQKLTKNHITLPPFKGLGGLSSCTSLEPHRSFWHGIDGSMGAYSLCLTGGYISVTCTFTTLWKIKSFTHLPCQTSNY